MQWEWLEVTIIVGILLTASCCVVLEGLRQSSARDTDDRDTDNDA